MTHTRSMLPSYREVRKELGIFQFNSAPLAIKSTVFPQSLQVSSVEPRNTVVVVSYSQHHLFVSRDYGVTWSQYILPTADFDPTGSLHLSALDPRHLVLKSRAGDVRECA